MYQDSAIYTYAPKSAYLGFTQNVRAECKGEAVALMQDTACPSEDRLCSAFNDFIQKHAEVEEITNNLAVLDRLIDRYNLKSLDTQSTIKASQEIGKEKAALKLKGEMAKTDLDLAEEEFRKQTAAMLPLYTKSICPSPLKLTFQNGMIGFDGYYEADMSDDGQVKVIQYLSVTNRSGIDIKADEATFYYRQAAQYVNPIHFYPWTAREYTPPVVYPQSAKPKTAARYAAMSDVMEPLVEAAPSVSKAYYNDAREYGVSGLVLPSSGVAVNVPILSWTAPVQCGLQLYAYANTDVYEACTFTPDKQIEGYGWKVKKGEEILNANASGEYIGQTYSLYTKIDPDIQVIRKSIVQKEGDMGFFGGTVRKKDGYTVEIVNKSDKIKKISVTERIPVSTNEKIEVKLLSVDAEYRIEKDGKIGMDITLAPKQRKKITVLFEVSYDKDMKIRY